MKKLALLIMFFVSITHGHSQEIYFQTGKNFTNYDYTNPSTTNTVNFKTGVGTHYELGYSKKFENIYTYSVGLTLNEYQTSAGTSSYNYHWNTQYVGIQNTVQLRLIKLKHIEVDARAGVNLSTIIFGQQDINGVLYDIVKETDFSGLLFQPVFGGQIKLKVSSQGFLSVGYNRTISYNLTNNSAEKLSFQNNQILFGIHFQK